MEDLKFPLSKKNKDQFVKDYELIFLKKPANSLKEEKLVELVNANRDKLTPNEKKPEPITNEQEQEGIQDETGTIDGEGSEEIVGDGTGEKLPELKTDEGTPIVSEEEKEARDLQLSRHKHFFGTDADESWTTEQIEKLNQSKIYFDLLGKFPLEDMTIEQIYSAIENERSRQEKAKAEAEKSFVPEVSEFEYNTETEMLIVSKTDPKNKRVINKGTFQFLKGEFDAVSEMPKELKNRK